ncbi:PBECR3 domain-containing polyvalent protein [Agrobacterium rosae]
MPTLDEYDAWKTKQETADVNATDFVLNNARKVNPDEFASDVKLGKAFGLTADLANAGRDMLQDRLNSLRNTSILKGSPRTAQWLKDSDNARAAWDDVENMSWFEGAARGSRNTLARSASRLDQVKNQYMLNQTAGRAHDRKMSFGEILDSERDTIETSAGTVRPWVNLSDLVSASGRYIDAKYADLIETDDEAAAREYAGALANSVDALKSKPKSGIATEAEQTMFKDGASIGEVFQNIGNTLLENPVGVMSWAAETAGEMTPQIASGIATTIVTKNPVAGTAVGLSANYATERFTAPADFLSEKGIDLSKAEGIDRLFADPDLLKEANDRGVIRGVVISAFDALSFGLAGRALSKNPLGEAVAQTVQQAVNGSLGEYAARKAAGQEIDWNEIIAEGLAEIASTPFDMGMAGRKFIKDRSSAKGAEEAKALIDQIGDNSASSKLRQRLDGSFMDFVGKATEGTPIEDIYVPAEKMQEMFQSFRFEPQEFIAELPGVDFSDWESALSTGGDIKIPTATYAAKLAGSDFDQFLRENMRFSPDAMTFSEAQEFNSRSAEIQMEAFEESEAARVAEANERTVDLQEMDELVGRLRAAGRSTDVARFEAMPLVAMRRTMAERSGLTQEEFAQRYPLPEVRGEVPEGLKPKNVDALNRQLAEMRSYQPEPVKNGPSLLEAISDYGGISDTGGELKARDAAVIKRGRGKKTLRLARGGVVDGIKDIFGASSGKKHGVDDVAQAMIEAGYLQGNPVAIEYRAALEAGTEVPDIGKALLDAIDEELRGNVQYAGETVVDERATSLERNIAYLDELGVSLNDSDDAIRAALAKAGAENGKVFGQATLRQKLAKLQKSMVDLLEFSKVTPFGENRTVEIAQVSDAVADLVQQEVGVDIHGYRHTIDTSAIRHIIKNHSDEKSEAKRGMVAITDQDMLNIPELIASADQIVTGAKSRRGEDLIGYLKKLEDGTTLYIEEARRGRKALAAVSMRKYPATIDSSSIAKTISPNVRNDGGIDVTITDVPANSKTLFQAGRRGSIQLPLGGAENSAVIISLFESADLSTFLHETGHYFLNTLEDLRTVSPDIQEMHDGVRTWWGDNVAAVADDAKQVTGLDVTADHVKAVLEVGTTGDAAIDAAVGVGMHEQFARGFESYLMEGKAPSIELRSAFERFTQWLVRLYKNLRGLNVQVSPEMRGVFDCLLATDEEIEAARSDMSDQMLFAAAEAAGLNPGDYRHLVKLHDQSVEAANEKLRREVMAPIRRETERWFREEKARVRDEVSQSINKTPVYRALEWLGNRRWLGDEAPQGMPDMRLDRQTLVDRYGEGVLQTLPRGRFTIYANEGGMNPDEVAGWFGFDSGDALVKALEQAQPRREAIDAETDRVMRERHGDVLRDGQIEERAIDALHNDKRAQFLAAELKVLKARAGDTSVDMTVAQAREAARLTVNRMKVRDAVASNRFLTAERKAANEAIKLARLVERENLWSKQRRRDVQAAVKAGSLRATNSATDRVNVSTDRYNDAVALLVEQKRRQLLNHMLYSESVKAAEEVEKTERYVSRLSKRSTRQALAGDYLEAIDELLERYDFRKLSARAEDRRGSLLNFVARMTAEGRENELSIPDDVLQNAQRRPYKQLTVDELRGIVDTLKNIEHTARLKQRLKDAKRERDLETVVDDIIAEFDENVKGNAPSRAKSGRGGTKEGFRSYLNLVKTADTILREIDGFEDGAAYRHIKAPIDEAVNDLTIKRREAGEKFEQLYSVYSKEERREMTTLQSVSELNGQYSKWDLISIALNVGNEGNYQRLTDNRVKGHFQPGQIEVALSRLDERDWKFVQSAWDMIDEYWPEIEAREKRVTGVAPEKIAPREVQTKFGTVKGGYFPLKYDAEISSLARDDDLHDLAASMTGGRFGKAQTKNGHTKERSNSSGRPVMIDIGVLHGHVNQVIHDLALSEVVANSWRILQNNEVKSAFLDRGLKSDFDSLEVWLQDVASGEVRGADFMNRWARKMKSGFTVSKLAFNLTTVLLQPTGLAQSFVVVGKKNMLLGIQDVFRRPLSGPGSAASIIINKSPFMQERETTFNKDIYDILGDTKTGPTQNRVSQFASDYLAPWGFWLMQKAQFYTVDMPTWLAGYRQAVGEGKSEANAIAHADRIVARAASSGNFADRTPIERGSLSRNVRQNDVVRLFTALGSYMFAKFNVAFEKTRQTEFTDPRQVLSWTSDMVMLFTVEALLAAAVRGQLPWGDDDDDEEEGWAEFLAKQTAFSVAGTLPFVRDIASGVQGFSGGGAYGSIMDTIARPIFQASQGEVDKALIRSMVDAGGLFLHLPSTQINRFIDATWRQSEGDDVSPIEYIMGKSK